MGEYEFENKLRKDQKADKIFNWLQNSILMGFCSFFIYKLSLPIGLMHQQQLLC